MLDGVIGILRWEGCEQEARDYAESAYTSMLAERLGTQLGELEKIEPNLATHILRLLDSADTAILRRVLLAPETSCRLLWGHPAACDDRNLWEFLSDAFEIELALRSHIPKRRVRTVDLSSTSRGRWPALGDIRINGVGEDIVMQPSLAGLIVDSDSPAAVCFDGQNDVGIRLQHYSDALTKERAISKMEKAMLALVSLDPGIATFVRRFTLVANLVSDSLESGFSSGSTDQYIGRSIFWNAHLPGVSVEVLAEALVHEAIHSLLYMHEVRESWFGSTDENSPDAWVESPWTGAIIRLEPFLQACFVWFGLTNFWTRAQYNPLFNAQRLQERLNTARRGFLVGPLLSRIAKHKHFLAPEIRELIRYMQQDIMSREERNSGLRITLSATAPM